MGVYGKSVLPVVVLLSVIFWTEVMSQSNGLKCTRGGERCILPFSVSGRKYDSCVAGAGAIMLCPIWRNGRTITQECAKCEGETRCYLTAQSLPETTWTLTCPPGCAAVTSKLWGSNNEFSEDSYICAAAIHEGEIRNDEGGIVQFFKLPWRKIFNGELKNGILSKRDPKRGFSGIKFKESIVKDPVHILFSSTPSIFSLPRRSTQASVIQRNRGSPHAVAVDIRKEKIYWTDVSTRSIFRANFDGERISDIDEIIRNPKISAPEVIAIDWVHGNIYWTDSSLHKISIAKDDGEMVLTLIQRGQNFSPRGLSLDPHNGYFYITDSGPSPKIERCLMSENDSCVVIINKQIEWPMGLVIDIGSNILCWTDMKLQSISCSNMDGTERRDMNHDGRSIKSPYSIALYRNRVYWTDLRMQSIISVNRETWKDLHYHIGGDLSNPAGLIIYDEEIQEEYANQCRNEPCSQLCVPSPTGFKCLCKDGFEPADVTKCRPVGGVLNQVHIYVADVSSVKLIKLNLDTRHVVGFEPVQGMRGVSAVVIDTKESMLYWADNFIDMIQKGPVSDNIQQAQPVLDGSSGYMKNVQGMAIDYVARLLYWTDSELHAVFVSNLDPIAGQYFVTQIVNGTKTYGPRSIVLDPNRGQMYIADAQLPSKIQKCDMKGDPTCHSVIDSNIVTPNGVAIDLTTDRLYFTDTTLGKLESSDLNGENRKIIIKGNNIIGAPFAVGIFEDRVYWTQWETGSLMSADKLTGYDSTSISRGFMHPMGMDFIDLQKGNIADDSVDHCASNTCQYLCVPSPRTPDGSNYFCLCPEKFKKVSDAPECEEEEEVIICQIGYVLAPNKRSCTDLDECKDSNGGCEHTCLNSVGSYKCECWKEYELSKDGKTCSAKLVCKPGYLLSSDKTSCNDINECNVKNGGCDQKCNNYVGSFKCECIQGYELQEDDSTCRMEVNMCSSMPCKNMAKCNVNEEDTEFNCTCDIGFSGPVCEQVRVELQKPDNFNPNRTLRLECIAPRNLTSRILWGKNRKFLELGMPAIGFGKDGRTLVIYRPTYESSGEYFCQVNYNGIEYNSKTTIIIPANPQYVCGQSPGMDYPLRSTIQKIHGGRFTRTGMAPFVAMLYKTTPGYRVKKGAFCGGSLVDTRYIISAAHCFNDVEDDEIKIYLGKIDTDISVAEPYQQSSDIENVTIHPDFDRMTLDYDIALILLKNPVYFSEGVKPICIPHAEDKANDIKPRVAAKRATKYGLVFGWGLKEDWTMSRYLMEVKIPIIRQKVCMILYPGRITDMMFCAGGERKKDSCEGDSGGPLTLWSEERRIWFLAGIVSWGESCGDEGKPGIYTRIGNKLRNWIYEKTDI